MSIRLIALVIVAAPLWAAGCERPEAEFTLSERTQELIAPARKAVQASVQENFGTPTKPVAWLRLPVEYGGYYGRAAATQVPEAESKVNQIKVTFQSEVAELPPQAELIWMSGKYQAARQTVTGYDAEAHVVTVTPALEEPPDEGDEFVVNPAHIFKEGRKLYAIHCQHCHGVSGDGDGPTAKYLNPLPRDYRLGLFKFTSTRPPEEKPSSDDLKRVIKYGIPGTYMPSFMLMDDDELEAIVQYVRWLSVRGEMEKKAVDELEGDYSNAAVRDRVESGENRREIESELTEYLTDDFAQVIEEAADDLAGAWTTADSEESAVVPKMPRIDPVSDAKSLERGRLLYLGDKAKCATCHGPTGRGDGPQTEAFQEITGKAGEFYPEPGLYDKWNHKIKPRDLTRGIYRGGRRPVDIYRRIYAGIKGTPMPPFGGTLTDQEIWDIVNYVMSIPYRKETAPATPAAQKLATTSSPAEERE